jgi:outer membrane protein assembly factor BamB
MEQCFFAMKRLCTTSWVVICILAMVRGRCETIDSILWEFHTGGPVLYAPVIDSEGTIYIGAGQPTNQFYAINPDGTEKWRIPMREPGQAMIGPHNTIIVGELWPSGGRLFALDRNGNKQWDFYPAGNHEAAVGIDGRIYLSQGQRLYALAPDGKFLWSYTNSVLHGCAIPVFGPPVIGADQTIYVTARHPDTRLFAFNPDGSIKWRFTTGRTNRVWEDLGECGIWPVGEMWSVPAIGVNSTIYVAASLNASDPARREPMLYALNSAGETNWHHFIDGLGQHSSVIGVDGTVYVNALSWPTNRLLALSATGSNLWQFRIPGFWSPSSPVALADGTALVGSTTGELLVLGANGTQQQAFAVGGLLGPPVVAPGGRIYVCSYEGVLYALRGTATLANTPWPMSGRNIMHARRAAVVATNPPSLVSLRRLSDSRFELHYGGEVMCDYQIEGSSDLMHWSPVSTFSSLGPVVPFRDYGMPDTSKRFYRLRSP